MQQNQPNLFIEINGSDFIFAVCKCDEDQKVRILEKIVCSNQ